LNGARGISRKKKLIKGSITIETAIVMPFFLVILLSLAYTIRIFHTYNTVQASLAETARGIGNMSYFYYMSGLKDYSDQWDQAAEDAESTLEGQKNTVVDAVTSFQDMMSGLPETPESGDISSAQIKKLLENAENIDGNMADVQALIQSVIADPKSELKLFLTIFTQHLTYEVRNKIVCYAARINLNSELNKRLGTSGDGAGHLGIKNGIEGVSFEQSSILGDTEALDFIVTYSVRSPMPLGAVIPELKLSNRVKIIAWTGGKGVSVKAAEEDNGKDDQTSLWQEMDQDKNYYERGLAMENLYVKALMDERENSGFQAFATPNDFPVIDAYTFNSHTREAEYYDVFTLNPFMKTYQNNPLAITSQIKRHGKKLLMCC